MNELLEILKDVFEELYTQIKGLVFIVVGASWLMFAYEHEPKWVIFIVFWGIFNALYYAYICRVKRKSDKSFDKFIKKGYKSND